jgi:hypothetical protein
MCSERCQKYSKVYTQHFVYKLNNRFEIILHVSCRQICVWQEVSSAIIILQNLYLIDLYEIILLVHMTVILIITIFCFGLYLSNQKDGYSFV